MEIKTKNILFVVPPFESIYKKAEVKGAVPQSAQLTFAVLAAPLLEKGHSVKIFDFNFSGNNLEKLIEMIKKEKPDVVGMTCPTPLFHIIREICDVIKRIDSKIMIVAGGPHVSSIPKEALKQSLIDIAVVGEGDFTLQEIFTKKIEEVSGIGYKKNNEIICNPRKNYIQNLDLLPLPAWNLYDLSRYKSPKILCKENPLGFMETSRGCVFNCSYCNKSIFGQNFRYKSPERVITEIKYMLKVGFKEIYIVDDGFTTSIERAKKICRMIIEQGIKFHWQLTNGIRVDRVDKELFFLLKKAGCYRVAFGIESGNEDVLKDFGKKTNLNQVRNAVKWAKEAGIETWGYFILGLPADTEKTMKQTIDFAKSLGLTLAKFSICTPYPGTALFYEYEKKGLIKSKNWADYNVYEPHELYNHPNLSWDIIYKYYKKAYRTFYMRSGFIFKRIMYSLKNKTLLEDAKSFLNLKW